MGQQLKAVVKRTRRKNYLARKKALAKAGVSRRSSGRTKVAGASDAPKPAKKVAAAKKPAAKKAAKAKAPESAAEE